MINAKKFFLPQMPNYVWNQCPMPNSSFLMIIGSAIVHDSTVDFTS